MALSLPLYKPEDLLAISSVKKDALAAMERKVGYEAMAAYNEAHGVRTEGGEETRFVDEAGNAYLVTARGDAAGWTLKACEPNVAELVVPPRLGGVSIIAIGAGAFQGSETLQTLSLPDTVTSIGPNAFVDCAAMRALRLPAHLDRFEAFWLRGCGALRRLVLPGALKTLRQGILEYCPLSHLAIGPALESIDLGFFKNSVLETVTIDAANPSFKTDGELIYSRDGATLVAAAVHRAEATIAEGCETIARKAFFFDEALREVTLPKTLRVIEGYAFSHTGLEDFQAPPALRSIGIKAFFRAQHLKRAQLGDELRELGDEAFAQTSISSLRIPARCASIGKRLVADTPIRVAGPEATLSIDSANPLYTLSEDGALYRSEDGAETLIEVLDRNARAIVVRKGTTAIGYRAFVRHGRVEQVVLPEGLRLIGESSFRGCTRLTTINLPESLERIEAEAFLDTRVERLVVPPALQYIGRIALITRGGNRALRPPSLKAVEGDPGNERFYMASGILCERTASGKNRAIVFVGPEEDVVVPKEVVDLEDYAFAGVIGLRSLTLHRGIRHLGASVFVLGGPVPLINIELSDELAREAQRPWLSIDIPLTYSGARTLTLATTDGRIDAVFLRRLVDNVILTLTDLGERARYCLPRLIDPVFLDSAYEERFRRFLTRSLAAVACRFAKTSYWEGFEQLLETGFLNPSTITAVIDAVGEDGSVEATSYLLEMKHRRLGAQTLDFDL